MKIFFKNCCTSHKKFEFKDVHAVNKRQSELGDYLTATLMTGKKTCEFILNFNYVPLAACEKKNTIGIIECLRHI